MAHDARIVGPRLSSCNELAIALAGSPPRRVSQRSVDEAASFVYEKWNEVNEAGSFVYGQVPHNRFRFTLCTDREEIEK